jgi:hypothetical protein
VHFELTVALNAGAIIHMPDRDDEPEPIEDLRGHRFRLAYLLAPGYRIGLATGRAVTLSRILSEEAPVRVPPGQLILGVESDEDEQPGAETAE